MGTRADFYIGCYDDAKWIGSVSQDGGPFTIPGQLFLQNHELTYEVMVEEFLRSRDPIKVSIAANGDHWPWPWPDSRMTDYTYMFNKVICKVLMSHFGSELLDPILIVQGEDMKTSKAGIWGPDFPKMVSINLEKPEVIH